MSADPVEIFRQEAADLLEALEQALLDLERRPGDRDLVNTAFRALHTIKGSGAMFGFDDLAGFAHEFETVFDRVRRGESHASPALIAVALNAQSFLRTQIETPDEASPAIGDGIRRVLRRPLKVLGYDTQRFAANWKNYHENPRDSFHANILHTFYGTFGLSRQAQESAMILDDHGRHVYFYTKVGTDRASADYAETAATLRSHNPDFRLEDTRLLKWVDEFGDGVNMQILTLYPSFVLHQVCNSIAVRQLVPRSPTSSDLHWTYLGFADEPAGMTDTRLFQTNLVGSAGLVSMEDTAVCEMVRRGTAGSGEGEASFMEMGGKDLTSGGSTKLSEKALRNFWNTYRVQMGL